MVLRVARRSLWSPRQSIRYRNPATKAINVMRPATNIDISGKFIFLVHVMTAGQPQAITWTNADLLSISHGNRRQWYLNQNKFLH